MSDDPTRREDGSDGAEPLLSPEEEAGVRGLLAALPDPQLPADVERRIVAAVGAELPAGAPADADLPPVPPSDTPTRAVLAARPPSGRWRQPWILQSAAVLVIVALIGAVVVSATSIGGNGGSATPDQLVLSQPDTGPITSSGRTYSPSTLSGQVRGLVAGGASDQSDDATEAASAGSQLSGGTAWAQNAEGQAATALVTNEKTRQACIDQLASVPGARPVAIDVGIYDGKPAAVIVLPDEADPTVVAAWVVGPTCSTADNPFPYRYERVTRP